MVSDRNQLPKHPTEEDPEESPVGGHMAPGGTAYFGLGTPWDSPGGADPSG